VKKSEKEKQIGNICKKQYSCHFETKVIFMMSFKSVAIAIFSTFMGLMLFVTIVAYVKPSGRTGLDMAKVQKLRYDNNVKRIQNQ